MRKTDNEKHLFSILFLFNPSRKECELTHGYSSIEQSFNAKKADIDTSCESYSLFRDQVSAILKRMEVMQLFPSGSEGSLNDININPEWTAQNATEAALSNDNPTELCSSPSLDQLFPLTNNFMSDEDFWSAMNSLSSDQKHTIDL